MTAKKGMVPVDNDVPMGDLDGVETGERTGPPDEADDDFWLGLYWRSCRHYFSSGRFILVLGHFLLLIVVFRRR